VRATRRLLPYALAEKRRSEVLVAIEVEPVDEGEADFSAVHLSGGDRCEPQELLKALFRTRTGDPLLTMLVQALFPGLGELNVCHRLRPPLFHNCSISIDPKRALWQATTVDGTSTTPSAT
jgi:hypothetical protein